MPPDPQNPTQPAAPPKQGFGAILKNKILPMIGPLTARLGAAFGNSSGLEEEYRQKALQMAQPGYQLEQEQVAEAPLRRSLLEKQVATTPGSFEEQLAHLRDQERMKSELTPTTGMIGGNLEMGSFVPGEKPGSGLDFVPAQIKNAIGTPQGQAPPAQLSGAFPDLKAAPQAAPEGDASAPPPQFVGAPVRGIAGPVTYDHTTNQWVKSMLNPYTMQIMQTIPTETPAGYMPPRTVIPYLPSGVTPENATQADWATAANTYNTRTTAGQHLQVVYGPDGQAYTVPLQSSATMSRGAAPATGGPSGSDQPPAPAPVGSPKPSVSPKAAGSSVPKPIAGIVKVDPSVKTASTEYQAAIARSKVMHNNLKDAMGGNQQAMLSLLANHLGMTAGLQKGARLNQAMWEEAMKSTPWLQQVLSRYFAVDPQTGDHILTDPQILGGVVLTPEQMKQMVGLGDQMVDIKKQQWDAQINAQKSGFGMGDTTPAPIKNALAAGQSALSDKKPTNADEFFQKYGK